MIISQEEIERKINEENSNKRRIAFLEEFKKANKPTQVFLSAYIRNVLEEALGLNKMKNDIKNNSNNGENNENGSDEKNPKILLDNLLLEITDSGVIHENEFNSVNDTLSVTEQIESVKNVVADLRKTKFTDLMIFQSLSSTIKTKIINDEITQKLQKEKKITREILHSIIHEKCIEYICLNVDDSDLPPGFDPRKNEQRKAFEVFKKREISVSVEDMNSSHPLPLPSTAPPSAPTSIPLSTSTAPLTTPTPHSLPNTVPTPTPAPVPTPDSVSPPLPPGEEERILDFIARYGWSHSDCKKALVLASALHTHTASSLPLPQPVSLSSPLSTSSLPPSQSVVWPMSPLSADTPGHSGPITDPAGLPPLGVSAVCLLWLATRCVTVATAVSPALPSTLPTSSPSTNKIEDMNVLQSTVQAFLSTFVSNNDIQIEAEKEVVEAEGQMRDEIESLCSIFSDSLQHTEKYGNCVGNNDQNKPNLSPNCHFLTVAVGRENGNKNENNNKSEEKINLDVFLIPFMGYPAHVPMMLVRTYSQNNDKKKINNQKTVSLSSQNTVFNISREYEGDCSIFQVLTFLEDNPIEIVLCATEGEKHCNSSISVFMDYIYTVGMSEKKIDKFDFSLLRNQNGENKSEKNNGNNGNNLIESDGTSGITSKESKEYSSKQPIPKNVPRLSSDSLHSTSILNSENMSEISVSNFSEKLKTKKTNKQSFWYKSDINTTDSENSKNFPKNVPNVPKSAQYVKMLEGRKKLPSWKSR